MIDVNVKLGPFPYRPVQGLADLLKAMDRHGVAQAVVSALPAPFYLNPQDANEELARLVAPHLDRLLPVAVLRPNFTGWRDDLRRCLDDFSMRGVLLYPNYHRFDLADPALEPLMDEAARRGVPVCVQMWLEDPRRQFDREIVQPTPVEMLSAFVRAYPGAAVAALGLRFGQPEQVADPLPEHFHFDISNYEHMNELELALERFPAGRMLFGTNFPLYNYPANVEKLARAAIPDDARAAIAEGNARRLWGLRP